MFPRRQCTFFFSSFNTFIYGDHNLELCSVFSIRGSRYLESFLGAKSMERIHNFFGQEGLSQDQHQSQVVDGSWSGFSNGLVGNQRHIDPSSIAGLKSYSTQQPGMRFVHLYD